MKKTLIGGRSGIFEGQKIPANMEKSGEVGGRTAEGGLNMGVWGQMSDGTAVHIDFAVKKNCWNMEAYCYGNCYGCGCCAKDKKQRYENRIRYLNGMIEEQEHFNNWFDEPEMRALQEKNRQANIEYFKKKLAYYTKKLKKLEADNGLDKPGSGD